MLFPKIEYYRRREYIGNILYLEILEIFWAVFENKRSLRDIKFSKMFKRKVLNFYINTDQLTGAVNVYLGDPPLIGWHVRFTWIPFNY